MKKIFLAFIITIFAIPVFAIENNSVLNLKTGNSYIIPLNYRPMELQNSNSRIVTAETVTGIVAEDSSFLITALEEGISYLTFKKDNEKVTVKILIDNNAEEDKNLIILDKPEGVMN